MIEVESNMGTVIGLRLKQIQELKNNPDPILRQVALSVLPVILDRVHVQGKDSSGGQIGTYSPEYMKVRTGSYKDSASFKKGPNAGKEKTQKKAGEAGNYRSGEKKGTARPVYNRTGDTKVVASLTRQMERDLTVIDTPEGYGIGYLNSENFKKAGYVEATYQKPILTKLTTEEMDLAITVADNFTFDQLKT